MNLSEDVTWPVMAALYHPPGGIIRHDAVVWGYARRRPPRRRDPSLRGGDRNRAGQRPRAGMQTTRGDIECDTVIGCTAGWSTLVADLEVPLPITTHILRPSSRSR